MISSCKANEKVDETTSSPAASPSQTLDQKASGGPSKATAENDSTIDFDLNELKKLEQYRGDKSIESTNERKETSIAFEYSQPLPMTAFQLGIIERSCQHPSTNPMEMFIPQLKAGISNRVNQTQAPNR